MNSNGGWQQSNNKYSAIEQLTKTYHIDWATSNNQTSKSIRFSKTIVQTEEVQIEQQFDHVGPRLWVAGPGKAVYCLIRPDEAPYWSIGPGEVGVVVVD